MTWKKTATLGESALGVERVSGKPGAHGAQARVQELMSGALSPTGIQKKFAPSSMPSQSLDTESENHRNERATQVMVRGLNSLLGGRQQVCL